jgi:hypothetical protein
MAVDSIPATKVCAICHELKSLDAFARRTRSADGRQRHCKACGRQMLDAADARRRAAAHGRPPITPDFDSLVALIEARADEVARALWEAAAAGAEFPLQHLADTLEPTCPTDLGTPEGDGWCEVHELAFEHYLVRTGQKPPTPLPSPVAPAD